MRKIEIEIRLVSDVGEVVETPEPRTIEVPINDNVPPRVAVLVMVEMITDILRAAEYDPKEAE